MSEFTKEFYNEELETTERYKSVWKFEKTQVREITDLIVRHHYWEDSTGEFWSDFDDPMENPKADFIAYRARKNYMTPGEVKKLREHSGKTVRTFAHYLGIGSSTLSQLENNRRVQTKEQDSLLTMVSTYYLEHQCLPKLGSDDLINQIVDEISMGKTTTPTLTYQVEHNDSDLFVYDKLSMNSEAA